ncbi:DsbA family protein [Pseudomonas sp. GX19020]|uniref:DsbA family protein n=1 Tax=Pseudomonas sp. GX19020 TaxID=2942277 RepID=UPI00201937F4|nr:DsbA family protein [Pseudomonas sp. GX19020]MCL4068171.1 DsbA family protein [Pseudomonas sp. GX19020]
MASNARASARLRPVVGKAAVLAVGLAFGGMAAAEGVGEQDLRVDYSPEFGAGVRAYLLDNPEVVLEVFTILEQQETAKKGQAQIVLIAEHAEQLFAGGDAAKGNPSAPIRVVEFFDYSCGYCKAALAEVTTALEGRDDVALILKEFPILGQASENAARLAMAVRAEHGDAAYVAFHNALLGQKGALNDATLATLAGAAGYDFDALMQRGRGADIRATIAANKRLAQALSINGTPAFVFEDELVGGMMQADRLIASFDRVAARQAQ